MLPHTLEHTYPAEQLLVVGTFMPVNAFLCNPKDTNGNSINCLALEYDLTPKFYSQIQHNLVRIYTKQAVYIGYLTRAGSACNNSVTLQEAVFKGEDSPIIVPHVMPPRYYWQILNNNNTLEQEYRELEVSKIESLIILGTGVYNKAKEYNFPALALPTTTKDVINFKVHSDHFCSNVAVKEQWQQLIGASLHTKHHSLLTIRQINQERHCNFVSIYAQIAVGGTIDFYNFKIELLPHTPR